MYPTLVGRRTSLFLPSPPIFSYLCKRPWKHLQWIFRPIYVGRHDEGCKSTGAEAEWGQRVKIFMLGDGQGLEKYLERRRRRRRRDKGEGGRVVLINKSGLVPWCNLMPYFPQQNRTISAKQNSPNPTNWNPNKSSLSSWCYHIPQFHQMNRTEQNPPNIPINKHLNQTQTTKTVWCHDVTSWHISPNKPDIALTSMREIARIANVLQHKVTLFRCANISTG